MPQYMLLLHEDPSAFDSISPDDMQKIVERYVAWGTRLREAGLLGDSHKLTDEPGRVMRRRPGQMRVTDGPYSETKEVLGGYFLIAAGRPAADLRSQGVPPAWRPRARSRSCPAVRPIIPP